MKPAGAIVTLTMTWTGELPTPGDALRTSTGRRYRLIDMHGKRWRCQVMSSDEQLPDGANVHEIYWSARRKQRRGRAPIF